MPFGASISKLIKLVEAKCLVKINCPKLFVKVKLTLFKASPKSMLIEAVVGLG